jgi:hypothetical protein
MTLPNDSDSRPREKLAQDLEQEKTWRWIVAMMIGQVSCFAIGMLVGALVIR